MLENDFEINIAEADLIKAQQGSPAYHLGNVMADDLENVSARLDQLDRERVKRGNRLPLLYQDVKPPAPPEKEVTAQDIDAVIGTPSQVEKTMKDAGYVGYEIPSLTNIEHVSFCIGEGGELFYLTNPMDDNVSILMMLQSCGVQTHKANTGLIKRRLQPHIMLSLSRKKHPHLYRRFENPRRHADHVVSYLSGVTPEMVNETSKIGAEITVAMCHKIAPSVRSVYEGYALDIADYTHERRSPKVQEDTAPPKPVEATSAFESCVTTQHKFTEEITVTRLRKLVQEPIGAGHVISIRENGDGSAIMGIQPEGPVSSVVVEPEDIDELIASLVEIRKVM